MQQSYQRLVSTAQATVTQVKQVLARFQHENAQPVQRGCQVLATFLPRVEQVIQQTVRRVFDHESVPASEKIVSHWSILDGNPPDETQ